MSMIDLIRELKDAKERIAELERRLADWQPMIVDYVVMQERVKELERRLVLPSASSLK